VNAPNLLCFGNLTIDDVVLPGGQTRENCTGGDCFYAAVAARLFEPSVEMVAPVGTDLPDEVRARIARAGLSLDGLTARDALTIRNRVAYDEDGGRKWTLLTPESDFHLLSPMPEDVPEAWRAAPCVLVLAMTLEAQETLVAGWSRTASTLVALDPQEDYIFGNEQRLLSMIATTNLFLPSEIEIERLLGHRDARRAARQLADLGPSLVVIKQGADGVTVFDAARNAMVEVPAIAGAVLDTTGAGDSFCGAFTAVYSRNPDDPVRAAAAGAAAASFAVSDFGVDGLLRADPGEATDRMHMVLSRVTSSA
jgi:ribokinase